ncbi:hypothetical protein, conserved [Leishmania lindenbergi]|uniref:BRCT domain-containing protein n=1 Tax=Leishmania lindenbergi TaxID=651832 RepID=A0AAW3AWG4_9TRYP
MHTCNSALVLYTSSSLRYCLLRAAGTLALPPLCGAPMSLADMEEADTVEFLSEDSCSTVSALSQDVATTTADTSLPLAANTDEEQLRRHTMHEFAFMPELRPQPSWLEQSGIADDRPFTFVTEMSWDAAHADHLIVAVRWRVALASSGTAFPTRHATPWVPYAVPLATIITTGTTAMADMANTVTSTTSSSGDGSGATTQLLGSVQLRLGRSAFLLAAQLSSFGAGAWGSNIARESLANVAASISRAQCTLHLHYAAATTPQAPSLTLTRPVCRSFDIFAISPTTTLLGVALQPHQRYHIKRKRGTGKSAHTVEDQPCDADGVLTLRVGLHCHVDVALDGVPSEPRAVGRTDTCSSTVTNTYNGSHTHTTRSGQTQDGLAVHRTFACQSDVARERPETMMQLRRGWTTSLITGDSTAVLATLSDVSDPVALSGTSDHGHGSPVVPEGQEVAAAPSHAPNTESLGDALRESRKRRRSTTTCGSAAEAVARRANDAEAVKGEEDDEADAAATPSEIVLFTTGIRLSDAEEKTLKELGSLVNPHLRLARYARVLVAQRPLVRSVKLLTVLPYVHDVVHQSWLDAVLHKRTLDLPVEDYAYKERKIAGSIESENGFDLRKTMGIAPAERQRLFAQQRFWVHKSATPQEPPMNDLKTVLTASGGVVTRRVLDADVLVLPNHKPTLSCWRGIAQQLGGVARALASSTPATLLQCKRAGVLFVVPDDIFKCVLQQRPLSTSTIALPRQFQTEATSPRGSAGAASARRRSSQSKRAPTTQRSSQPSSHKRAQ